ncbi:hypothetical protein M2375_003732 [Comamonas sp. BIGb0152]|uniref:MafI family immunity protein n=1 Tax=Comamonas sp. BIGb0152 TaxID=2940601 RepID=UPI00216A1055|nr:MafI family immunity protein [Comamonas sp. BIGb0152]MCS4295489.1 hypothetical protein [Comamonas sp. BIGb0152]
MPDFKNIEYLLSQLMLEAQLVFSDVEMSEVQRFIAVGEYGLALETIVDIYFEEKKVASMRAINIIESLAYAMSMDPISLLRGISK